MDTLCLSFYKAKFSGKIAINLLWVGAHTLMRVVVGLTGSDLIVYFRDAA